METSAICIGEKWLPYRENEHFFIVHSVFNRVINLASNQKLISIAAEEAGKSSSFLTVQGRHLNCGAEAGMSCSVSDGNLLIGNNVINFKNAALWKGKITKGYRKRIIKKDNIAALKAVLDRKAPPKSAWTCTQKDSECRFTGLKAIARLAEDPLKARNLIGLGVGLTPSGDDMLVGFLSIVNHTHQNREYVRILHNIVADSINRTVDLSAQVLANSIECDYHEYVQNCIWDLCEGEMEDVYLSAASLISMGATSGSDIACGMYFGMII